MLKPLLIFMTFVSGALASVDAWSAGPDKAGKCGGYIDSATSDRGTITETDSYKILGIDRRSDETAAKAAFRSMAMKYHPDRNGGSKAAEADFKKVNDAYVNVLREIKGGLGQSPVSPNQSSASSDRGPKVSTVSELLAKYLDLQNQRETMYDAVLNNVQPGERQFSKTDAIIEIINMKKLYPLESNRSAFATFVTNSILPILKYPLRARSARDFGVAHFHFFSESSDQSIAPEKVLKALQNLVIQRTITPDHYGQYSVDEGIDALFTLRRLASGNVASDARILKDSIDELRELIPQISLNSMIVRTMRGTAYRIAKDRNQAIEPLLVEALETKKSLIEALLQVISLMPEVEQKRILDEALKNSGELDREALHLIRQFKHRNNPLGRLLNIRI